MHAIVKTEEGQGAVFKEVMMPEANPEEVVVKVSAAAICGTDMHIYDWNTWAVNANIKLPLVLGHEFCGEVVSVGKNVKNIKPGDYVAGETHIPCKECYQCKNGQQHICQNLVIYGVNTDGCFAEYTKIPEICAKKIPSTIKKEVGAVFEPLGTALRSCLELQVTGNNVAIIGCGPIGLFAVGAAKAMGASNIIAIDILKNKLDSAVELGADYTINSVEDDVVEKILSITGGNGVDSFIDASGNVSAIVQGFKYLRKGGKVALVGLPSKPIELDLGNDVIFKEATIIGIHGREMFGTWTKMENMIASGLLNVESVITHVLPLSKFEEGISKIKSGEASKVILIP